MSPFLKLITMSGPENADITPPEGAASLKATDKEVFTLPMERRNALEQKFNEYRDRLEALGEYNHIWPEHQKTSFHDALYKMMIAKAVLDAPGGKAVQTLILSAVTLECQRRGIGFHWFVFFNAWHVIRDYSESGGASVLRGTGFVRG